MKIKKLSGYLERLEKTSSRIEMTKILAELLRKSSEKEIDKVVNLSLGRLAPPYETKVFNLAERMMFAVLALAYKKKKKEIISFYKEKGDLGDVAGELASGKGKGLETSEVFERLVAIAKEEGKGSQERKIESTARLLADLDPLSAKFVVRIPIGKLRLGFSDKTILDALSWMQNGDKSAKKELEGAYNVAPNVGLLAREVKEKGVKKATQALAPKVGIPVLPMLSQRLKKPSEMIEKMGEVAVEPKLDGLRLQIHFGGKDTLKAYTRNLNETSWMFPELLEISKELSAKKAILDVEAVGVDEERQRLADFQTTMTRRRKHEIETTAGKVPLVFYVFDVLLADGTNAMEKKYLERRKILERVVKEGKLLRIVDYEITKDAGRIAKLNQERKDEGLEGIMVKKTDSKYVPGRTGWRWVKMKEGEKSIAKLSDTIDGVVMGYSVGIGKRTGFGLGTFLVGVRSQGAFKTLTKVGTGLTDEQFKSLRKMLEKFKASGKPKEYEVNSIHNQDYWVEPEIVVEIAADEITNSPTHTAGLALRFPRLVRFRGDKSAGEATTLAELKDLAKFQQE